MLFKVIGFLSIIALAMACKENEQESDESAGSARLMAFSFLNEGNYDEAELAFKKAIKSDPGNVLNYIDLALLYSSSGAFDKAKDVIADGLKADKENIDLKLVLAEISVQNDETSTARQQIREIISLDENNIQAFYLLAGLAKKEGNVSEKKNALLQIVGASPSNVLAQLELSELLAEGSSADSALYFIQLVKKISPAFSAALGKAYDEATSHLQKGKPAEAVSYIQRFHRLMESTRVYADSFGELEPPRLPSVNFEFYDSKFNQTGYQIDPGKEVTLKDISFMDATVDVGLRTLGISGSKSSVVALADDDGTGNFYVYTSFTSGSTRRFLFKKDVGNFTDAGSAAVPGHDGEDYDAAFADYNNDGYQDLLVLTSKGIVIYDNLGDGTFRKVKNNNGLNAIRTGRKLLVADFDQDADLDIYVACTGANQFFRNNGDGSFTEQAASMNLAGSTTGTRSFCFADLDSDGDLDIALLAADGTLQILSNARYSRFEDVSSVLKVNGASIKGEAIAAEDYNNDGKTDLLIASNTGGSYLLTQQDKWVFKAEPPLKTSDMGDAVIHAAGFIDFDNDGYEDFFFTATGATTGAKSVVLFHNESGKGFKNVSEMIPETASDGFSIGIADFNLDGDDDIFIAGTKGLTFLRNDGGNLNHYMQVQLRGLSYGNNKNNRFGIGAQVELKAGDLYQVKTIRRGLTNFGVGNRDSLEAVRIIWPNGSPQYVRDPSRRQKFIEEEKLKGSCPFLFTWNGKEFEFVKDMMWRSALGMPLAVSAKGDTTYAFSDPSQEYLLIPGEKLKPRNGKYSLRITEELWEAVYFDKAALVAVDHPANADAFVDERFLLPPFPGRELYLVDRKQYPVSVQDHRGQNVLSKIKAYDFDFVSGFEPGRFQGLAEDHDLILDLGKGAMSDSLYLFLRGWVFPTDASINASMTQSSKFRQKFPELQVKNRKGEWQTVIANMGYPMGKDKMVIVNLTGKFLTTKDRQVRIRTNMQLYWDEIFFTTGRGQAPVKMTDLKMLSADLSFRGYSKLYRKGGPYGPHWFSYNDTFKGQQWRDLTGNYTRFGDVKPLLTHADDEYIIANSGDEIAIEFDADGLPPLPKGWKRDFLIYSEGWVKDGDLNTAHGQTVMPLPFHKMPSYPYEGKAHYPAEERLKAYNRKYNTRVMDTEQFKEALKPRARK